MIGSGYEQREERDEESPWLRKFFLALVMGLVVLSAPLFGVQVAEAQDVTIDRPVVDRVGVLRPVTVDALEQTLQSHQDQTGVQIAVLIVESTGGVPIEDYSLDVAERWGGGAAHRDDGVLLTLAIGDHRNRIEVGYGLEFKITDSEAARILNNAAPFLREQDYDGAVVGIVDEVIELAGDGVMTGLPGPAGHLPQEVLWAIALILLLAGMGIGSAGAEWAISASNRGLPVGGTILIFVVGIIIGGFPLLLDYGGPILLLLYSIPWVVGGLLGVGLRAKVPMETLINFILALFLLLPLGSAGVLFYLDMWEGPLMVALISPAAIMIIFTIIALTSGGGGGGTYSGGFSSGGGSGGSSGGGGSFGGGGASGSW